MTQLMNHSVSDKGTCRTAPATPGLLNIPLNMNCVLIWMRCSSRKWNKSSLILDDLTPSSSVSIVASDQGPKGEEGLGKL